MNPVQPRGSKADLAARFPGCLMGLEPSQSGCALSGLPGLAPYLSSRGVAWLLEGLFPISMEPRPPAGLRVQLWWSPGVWLQGELGKAGCSRLITFYLLVVVLTASGSCQEALGSSLLCLTSPAVPSDWALFVVTSLVLSCCPAGPPLPSSAVALLWLFPGRAVGESHPEPPLPICGSLVLNLRCRCAIGTCSFILRLQGDLGWGA